MTPDKGIMKHFWTWVFLFVCILNKALCLPMDNPQGMEGHCVWYGDCGHDYPDGDASHNLNCAYNGPPKPIDTSMFNLVKEACPHLIPEDGSMPDLCCSEQQLMSLQMNFALPQAIIERSCPTCYYNFRKNFCDMTCHPQQSIFIEPIIIEGKNQFNQTVDMVQEITYYVHNKFNTETYDSCKNVQYPEMSDTIMKLLCGRWGSAHCDPQKWFNFMGSTSNGYSPFQITYEYGESDDFLPNGYKYHNPPIVPCNEAPPLYPGQPQNEAKSACKCGDCVDACKEGHCVWYGDCGHNYPGGDSTHNLNCAYNGPPKPIGQSMFELVKDVCPHLILEDGSMPDLCCSEQQLKSIQTNFALPQAIIERSCPTCYYNFRKNFCDMTCHPQQSRFIETTIIQGTNPEGQTVDMVKNITYYVHNEFNYETYDSCKNVQYPEMSDTIMKLLCGRWGSARCDPQKWFNFMGSTSNGYSPFQITYEYGETFHNGFFFHNPPIVPCKEAPPLYPGQPINETKKACECMDCPDACPIDLLGSH